MHVTFQFQFLVDLIYPKLRLSVPLRTTLARTEYWPGNPKTLGIFFTTSFLRLFFHLKNYLPGSSEYGLLKALVAFSADAGWIFFKVQYFNVR